MTRTASRIDKNQTEIVAGLRKAGYSVLSLASLGRGVPDILVASPTRTMLMEIKEGKHKLNKQQMAWHNKWPALVYVVRSLEDALLVMGYSRWTT